MGSYASIEIPPPENAEVLAYLREHREQAILVALNLGGRPRMLDLSRVLPSGAACKLLLSTEMDRSGPEALDSISLRPNEGVILELAASGASPLPV